MKKHKIKKSRRPLPRPLSRLLRVCFILAAVGAAVVIVFNAIMLISASGRIVDADTARAHEADCILVLGAGVREDGTPSNMLRDRIDTGVALYDADVAPKLLMSGDHGRVEYDEVNVMRDRALAAGVESADIFMDHAGFSTYDSLYRARDVFEVRRVIIVTQEYHLPRALYIARTLGLDALGVPADLHGYFGQLGRNLREIVARAKDMLWCIVKPAPVVLGEVIPISGNGEATVDKVTETTAAETTAAPETTAAATADSVPVDELIRIAQTLQPTIGTTCTVGDFDFAFEDQYAFWLDEAEDDPIPDRKPPRGQCLTGDAFDEALAYARISRPDERFAVIVSTFNDPAYTEKVEIAPCYFRHRLAGEGEYAAYFLLIDEHFADILLTIGVADPPVPAPYRIVMANKQAMKRGLGEANPALAAVLCDWNWYAPEPVVGQDFTIYSLRFSVEAGNFLWLTEQNDMAPHDGLPKPGMRVLYMGLSRAMGYARETEAEEHYAVVVSLLDPYRDQYRPHLEAAEVEFRTPLESRFGNDDNYFILATEAQLAALTNVDGIEAPYQLRIANRADILDEAFLAAHPALCDELTRRGWIEAAES